MTLRQFITQALLDSLYRREPVSPVREVASRHDEDALVLRDDCVLPQIRGRTTARMRSLTEKRIDEILDCSPIG